MAFTVTAAQKNTMLNTITTAAGASSTVNIYSGSVPGNADASLGAAILLVSLPCSATFAPAASAGVLTANAITQTNVGTSGTAAFYRLIATGGSTVLAQGAVGTSGSDMNLNTTTLVTGGPCVVSSFTISM